MRTIILSLFAIFTISPSFAQFGQVPQSKLESKVIQSKVLNTSRNYNILLPKSYDTDTDKMYPVLYLLHGAGCTNSIWYDRLYLKEIMDGLVTSGEANEMIVVTPEAGGSFFEGVWNCYYDLPEWKYETFFFTEFLPHIESQYRIISDKSHRAIGGFSLGGGASVWYAGQHTDMFGAVYAMSPTVRYTDELLNTTLEMVKGMNLEELAIDRFKKTYKVIIENDCVKYIEEADSALKDQLRSIVWFVDMGDDDHYLGLEWSTDFALAMRKAEIPCEYRVRNGGHDFELWHSSLYLCLPFVSRNFGK